MPKKIETDALIIGAGPCGLFQVFELGLLGIDSILIDSLPTIGGQCTELYPDKPIYDIPGIPVCTGEELIENLSKQIEPFSPKMILGDEVTELEANKDSFDIKTQKGQQITAKTVFIAGGVGSFQPRKIRLKGIDDYENKWLHYKVKNKESFFERPERSPTFFGGHPWRPVRQHEKTYTADASDQPQLRLSGAPEKIPGRYARIRFYTGFV